MMSSQNPKIAAIERRLARTQAPPAAPSPAAGGGLGAALEALLQHEVDRRVNEATDRQPKAPKLRRIMSDFDRPPAERWQPEGGLFDQAQQPVADREWIAPATREAPAKAPPTVRVLERDGNGQIRTVALNDVTYHVSRDGAGHLATMTPVSD